MKSEFQKRVTITLSLKGLNSVFWTLQVKVTHGLVCPKMNMEL